jgi:hypothetical protein
VGAFALNVNRIRFTPLRAVLRTVFARRMNCGKHALESSNRDHIDAPLLRER